LWWNLASQLASFVITFCNVKEGKVESDIRFPVETRIELGDD
jgi:hypothetical protein